MQETPAPVRTSRAFIKIEKIFAQKDQYDMKGEQVEADAFGKAEQGEAELVHFKRFVVRGTVTKGAASGPFTITISVRGNIVVFVAGKGAPVDHEQMGAGFAVIASQFDSAKLMRVLREPMHRVFATPLRCVCTVSDGFWFADVLHHLRDGGMVEIDINERPARVWPLTVSESLGPLRG